MNRSLFILLFIFSQVFATSSDSLIIKKRAAEIHRKILTLDTHCDTPLHMQDPSFNIGVYHEPSASGSGKIDLPRMQNGNLDAEFFAIFIAQKEITPENFIKAQESASRLLLTIQEMCAKYPAMIAMARTPDDAYKNEKNGILSAFLGIENGFALGHDIGKTQFFFDRGVRTITLCHTQNNDICDSSNDPKGPLHHGVSEFGQRVIFEMNRLGMLIDVSHVSDTSFNQIMNLSRAPVFASHSGCRALCDNPRNLTDDMIKLLAAKCGVLQVCVFSEYLKKLPENPERKQAFKVFDEKYGSLDEITNPEIRKQYRTERHEIDAKYPRILATVQDMVDHIEHVIKLVGIDHVGIGTDFDGGGAVDGCYEVMQMPNITLELVHRGYSKRDIAKIWGGNFMRVFERALTVAKEWPKNDSYR